jgi:uncharacterized protein (TIGR03437 family)
VVSGPLEVELQEGSRGFVTAMIHATDGLPIRQSQRMLLTLPGAVLRTQPGSNPARPQRLINYPGTTNRFTLEPDGSGRPSGDLYNATGPAWMEQVPANITVKTEATQLTVFPLDGNGQRRAALPSADVQAVEGGFLLRLNRDDVHRAPWFEVVTAKAVDSDVPQVPNNGIVNGAGFATAVPGQGAVAPGAIISIFGSNLATAEFRASALPLPTLLGGTRVNINGIPAPLFYVGPGQINTQVPYEISGDAAELVVTVLGKEASRVRFGIRPQALGLFTWGEGRAAALNQDFSTNSANNAARLGSIVQLFMTGVGVPAKTIASGYAALDGASVSRFPITATIGNRVAAVEFAGLAPGFVGLVQVNLRIPDGLADGDHAVVVSGPHGAANSGKISIRR